MASCASMIHGESFVDLAGSKVAVAFLIPIGLIGGGIIGHAGLCCLTVVS